MTEKSSLSKDSAPCTNDPDNSFTLCISQHITELIGCRLDWFNLTIGTDFPTCSTRDQLLALGYETTRLHSASWRDLTSESGCFVKCTIKQFQFTKIRQDVAEWKRDLASAFYLIAESSVQRVEEEYLVFDMSDAMNGIGGAMGLFLGWSILYLMQKCGTAVRNIFEYWGCKGTA